MPVKHDSQIRPEIDTYYFLVYFGDKITRLRSLQLIDRSTKELKLRLTDLNQLTFKNHRTLFAHRKNNFLDKQTVYSMTFEELLFDQYKIYQEYEVELLTPIPLLIFLL